MKPDRVLLSFSVVGMAAREAMLLKSFVRMLDGRTKQRWLFKPQINGDERQAADLIFLGDEGVEETQPGGNPVPRQLRMGVLALELFAKLDRPLRPDELERELNRMGTRMVQAQAAHRAGEVVTAFTSTLSGENVGEAQPSPLWRPVAEGSMHSEFAPTTVFPYTNDEVLAAISPGKMPLPVELPVQKSLPKPRGDLALDDGLRMLRWPHASMVSTPARLKLAAFMVGSSTSLGKLQATSGQTLQACAEFLQDLRAAGFLQVTEGIQQSSAGVASLGLGGSQTAAVPVTEVVVEKPIQPNKAAGDTPASMSLFSRIRARLGIPLVG